MSIQSTLKKKAPVSKKIAWSKPVITKSPRTKVKDMPKKTKHSRYT